MAAAFAGSGRQSAPRLIVLGRQGAGKGTQCARLATRLAIPHLSTGDLFRAEIASGTDLGVVVDRYVAAGELVPDDIVLDVVAARLGDNAQRALGYLLDGFPRTEAQIQALFEVLGADAAELAVEIDVPAEDVLPACPPAGCAWSAARSPTCTPRARPADAQPAGASSSAGPTTTPTPSPGDSPCTTNRRRHCSVGCGTRDCWSPSTGAATPTTCTSGSCRRS